MSGDSYTFAFVSKDTVRFVANNLVQTVGSIKPVTVTSAVEDIKIEYQLSGTAWVTTLPSTLAVGSYKARLSRAEDIRRPGEEMKIGGDSYGNLGYSSFVYFRL